MEALKVEYDVIIIGAGASGLMAAIAAARQGSSVLILEQKDKAGRKISATGNGKCNFTNLYQNPDCYHSDDSLFASMVLSYFDVSQTMEFFRELGIYPKERDGYIYPNSEQASSVVSVLMMECKRLKVQFVYQMTVKEIHKIFEDEFQKPHEHEHHKPHYIEHHKPNKIELHKPYYNVTTELNNIELSYKTADIKNKVVQASGQQTFYAKKIILATGGCASPKLGSDGSGYQLALNLGHSIIKPLPALVALKASNKFCKTVSGVRTSAIVIAYADNELLAREEGEIIFTDYGISGIPVMQVSRYVAKALDQGKKVHLSLDFLQELSLEELPIYISKRIEQNSFKTMEDMMIGLLNHKLSYLLISEAKLDPYKEAGKITISEINSLAHQMKEFKLQIYDTNSFENAQVCAGGVSTKEIDDKTMESKVLKDLYLVGELVDVDGTCGGYNLQWAWSSGLLVGNTAHEKK